MEKPKSVASALAMAVCCALATAVCPTATAELTHRWSFNEASRTNVPAGTTMADSITGATAVVRGNFSRFNGNELLLRGPSGNAVGTTTGMQTGAAISGYVDLPNGIISSKTNLSVEIWATPDSARTWMRVFDFGNTDLATGFGAGSAAGEINDIANTAPGATAASDGIRLTFTNGVDLNQQRMQARLNGGSLATADTTVATTAGTEYHYVLTFEDGAGSFGSSGGRMTWYRNAAPIASVDVSFRLSSIEDVNNWLGRSQFTGDTNAHASYNELRLYNHVLTPAEISANFGAGPDSLPGPPAPPPVADNVWSFTTQAKLETPSGTTFTDGVGGKIATLRGNGGSLTGGAVVLPGTTNGNQPAATLSAYLDLPNGIVSQTASASFEAWAAPLSSKNWQRLFDFGRCASTHGTGAATGEILDTATAPGAFVAYDNLSLTFNNAANLNSQQLEGQYDGNPAQFSFSTAATTAGTKYHYVLVVADTASGCQARWYRNGALQNSANFPFHLNTIEDVNNWIGRSMYAGDSNAHLSLDELRIYRRAITPGEVLASYVAGPDPAVGPPEPLVPAPIPSRRWTFDTAAGSAPAGTEFRDTATGEIVTVRGNNATLTGTQLVLPNTATTGNQAATALSAYLDLPNGMVSSRPSATYEAWITPVSSKTWQRIFDFGSASLTSGPGAAEGEIIDGPNAPGGFIANDNLVLSLNNNGVLGSHRLEAKSGGGSTYTSDTDLSSVTTVGTAYQFTLTVEDGGGASGPTGCLVKWYRNGTLAGSIDLPYRVADLNDVNNWIGRSMWAADMNANLQIDELRIYDRAISGREVLSSFTAGPDAVFPTPVAVADSALIHPGQKVLLDILANDTGGALAGSLEISTPPAIGSAVIRDGKILYTHSGSSADPVVFSYRVGNVSGSAATASVTVGFADSLRLTNPALAMPAAPPVNTWQLVDALPGLVFNQPLGITSPPGDTRRLFVGERMAKIKHIPDVTAANPIQNVFLDLQQAIAGRSPAETIEGGGNAEHGLLGLAFHPDYANNGFFYAAYTVRINGGAYYQRISRFKVSSDPAIADPTSESILLNQLDEGSNHDGGDLHFGPDGYLYYVSGDEENPNDFRLNSQKVNKDFFGGVFRLDVDRKPGNLEPNPHAAIPTDGGIARFSVPKDNPYVHTSLGGTWDGTYNGVAVTPLGSVRSEFWATGLRHTWRMSFDPETGDLWGGDVGQDTYEEVNKIVKGGNYGWVWREGAHNTAFTNPVSPAKPAGFSSIDPVYEYVHAAIAGGDMNFKGNSVVGGYVYRGARYPTLVGSYIFSDSVSGHVWQMNTATGATTRLTGLPGAYGVFSAQGTDPSNKDLLFAAYLTGRIMRLSTGSVGNDGFPATLTATGLFSDLTDLSPAPGLVPYEPNLTFWSDHAVKRRWFTIPDAIGRMTWSKEGNWTYPTGTVWVKHFDLELSRGNPASRKRIETRVFVKTEAGSYGVSYRWNEAQTEAALVEDAGAGFDLAIDDHGTPRTQRWEIPSRTSCLTCHTPQAGHALSFNTRQLNRDFTINGYGGNQLTTLSANGFLSNTPDPLSTLARHVRPDETQFPLEQRARSYFAVNCSYCHQAGGSVGGFWDGRAQLTLEQTGMINGVAENAGDSPLNRYIVPGDPTHSILLNRMAATNGFGRMPPLATHEVDSANVRLITDWIHQNASRPLYQQWRDGYFAATDPLGDKAADPDGDGISNHDEYLRGSSPLDGSGSWQAVIDNDSLQFLRKANRYHTIQTSDTLGQWQPWSVPEIENGYKTTDETIRIPLPAAGAGKRFFRFRISEP